MRLILQQAVGLASFLVTRKRIVKTKTEKAFSHIGCAMNDNLMTKEGV
jgi:hypothetical protein